MFVTSHFYILYSLFITLNTEVKVFICLKIYLIPFLLIRIFLTKHFSLLPRQNFQEIGNINLFRNIKSYRVLRDIHNGKYSDPSPTD
jgi:hypothetical protein